MIHTSSNSPPATVSCLNCAAPLTGRYCSECGQRATKPLATIGELVRDFVEETLQWDGKVAQSFRLLASRPGELSVAYQAGRRARFVSPVKLYLLCSALFFFIDAVAPEPPARKTASGKTNRGFLEAISTAVLADPVELRGDTSTGDRKILSAR